MEKTLKDNYKSFGKPCSTINKRLNQCELMLFTLNARANCCLLEPSESLPLFTLNKAGPWVVKKVDLIPKDFTGENTAANTTPERQTFCRFRVGQIPVCGWRMWKFQGKALTVIDSRYVTLCDLCGGIYPRTPYKCPEGLELQLPPLFCFYRAQVWKSCIYFYCSPQACMDFMVMDLEVCWNNSEGDTQVTLPYWGRL